MKRLLLTLGAASAVIAPAASVIACGKTPTYTIKVDNATSMNYLISIKDTLSSQPEIHGNLAWDIQTQTTQITEALFPGEGAHMLPGISGDDNKKKIFNGLDKFLYHLVGAINRDTTMVIKSTVSEDQDLEFKDDYFKLDEAKRIDYINTNADSIIAAFANVEFYADSATDGKLTGTSVSRATAATDIAASLTKVFTKA